MSGHSKWATIKRKKGVNDAKRGAIFTKMARNITMAAKENGADVEMNFALRLAVDKAKALNMPSDNIDRAIKKASGDKDGLTLTKTSYEIFLGAKATMIVDCQTDNVNRTFSELKNIIETSGAKIVSPGSVSWQFIEKGLVILTPAKRHKATRFGKEDEYLPIPKDQLELELLEIEGIDDLQDASDDQIEIFTSRENLRKVLKAIEVKEYKVESAELVKIVKEAITPTAEEKRKAEELTEKLEDHPDVEQVWLNIVV